MKIILVAFFSMIYLLGNSQNSYLVSVGCFSNQLDVSPKNFTLASMSGRTINWKTTPSFEIGYLLDTTKFGKKKIQQKITVGLELMNGDYIIKTSQEVYKSVYKESYLYLRYSPIVFLGRRCYVAAVMNFSYRINYYVGDDLNRLGLEKFGIINPITYKNLIKRYQLRFGPEFGVSLLKNKLLLGVQLTYGLFPAFQTFFIENLNYRYYCGGIFLTHNFNSKGTKK